MRDTHDLRGVIVAKLSAFKHELQSSTLPRSLVVKTYGVGRLTGVRWAVWVTKNAILSKHAGGYAPELRLLEPDLSDVTGKKYYVSAGKAVGMTLARALSEMLKREDYDDRIVVCGSDRPIAMWKVPEGLRAPTPCVFWPGVSVAEATAIQQSPLIRQHSREMVLLRVRTRRSTKERIERAAAYEQIMFGEISAATAKSKTPKLFGRKSNLSAFCLGAVLERVEKVEAVQRAADQFTGPPAKN
jgi:hypothetical protein